MLNKQQKAYSTIDEIEKFSALAEDWWNPNGKMRPLHQFNPARISYVQHQLTRFFGLNNTTEQPLTGLKILDVGCGGGLLSESMAILGADVTGIDVNENMIKVAKIHAKQSGLNIPYQHLDIQEMHQSGQKFDAVISMEVVEHVSDPEGFLRTCGECVKDNGILMVSTLNRTVKSYALAIVGAEYVLRWLPKGTHDWHMFLKPSEICQMVSPDGFTPYDMTGVTFNLFEQVWRLNPNDLEVNYIVTLSNK